MWVPLHVHSQCSILDATASIPAIVEKAVSYGMPAVALTDHGNLFGAVDFYKACKEAKIKPIIGCEVYVAPHSRFTKEREATFRTSYHLTLLAKDEEGYHNLCKLSSQGYLEGFYYNPRIDNELLQKHAKGLICLSGCMSSRLAREILQGSEQTVLEQIRFYRDLFGEDYYLEIQRHITSEEQLSSDGFPEEPWRLQRYREFRANQEKINQTLLDLSSSEKISLVATNDSHYIEREEWRAHEIFLNIASGEPCEIWEKDSYGNPKFRAANPKRATYPANEFYFKSPKQMQQLFHDVPEALENTLVIADKCQLTIDFKTKHYPVYLPPGLKENFSKEEQAAATKSYLWQLCEEGIPKRYTPERLAKVQLIYPDKNPMEVVRERLTYEMSIIAPKGMCDYLLIVWDFIHWAKTQGIPMGPGRGSGAGSIVLYLIGITDIEPLRFHLFFERFINPERISYPDIDVDICMDRRSDVVQYTLQKYGSDKVAQIITFSTMKARMAIKDVGRVLSVPLSKVNMICKLVPEDLNITIDKALEKDQELKNLCLHDEEAGRVIALARQLEGTIRGTGIHAAGLIIGGEPLMDLIPICNAKDSNIPATQFSMKPIELVGMLKIDFLGLKTLTAIQTCVSFINKAYNKSIDWVNLPLDDAATFKLMNQGQTLGIFQLESGGMQELAKQLHLDKFEEIIAVVSLYRPGPMDMIPSYIARKHGTEPIDYDHPWMKEILSETYGIMVYQEQVMQIASRLAGFSLGEGDVLRRAMGKKDLAEMASQRKKFREGALLNGISEEVSMAIFDKMEKFASYGFNKSHAAAYGFLSYVTAYLKANYPREWMASLMTCDSDDLTKVAKFMRESREMNIQILPPDVNEAGKEFIATSQGIRFAITGIKGVGSNVVEAILEERSRNGPYKSLYDFFKRIDTKKVGKKSVEQLIDAGAFDFTGWTRDALVASVEMMHGSVAKEQKETAKGIMSLFHLMENEEQRFHAPPAIATMRTKTELLYREKELLGLYLTGHPLDSFRSMEEKLSCVRLDKIEYMPDGSLIRAAFIIETVDIRLSNKTNKKFAIMNISDGFTSYELPIWSDLFEEKQQLMQDNQLIYAVLQIDKREGALKINCRWLDDLTKVDEAMISACDQAYDRAKQQAARIAFQRSAGGAKNKGASHNNKTYIVKEQANSMYSATKDDTLKVMHLDLDADKLQLSHLLKMKEIFNSHRGASPVKIGFFQQNNHFATVHIDTSWGVAISEALCSALKEIASLRQIEQK